MGPNRCFVALLAALFVAIVQAEAVSATRGETFDPAAPLKIDPAVRMGRLANGLTYYVRAHRSPPGIAELRLAVNVGSIVEEDAQQGYAHFIEHLALRATTNFPEGEIRRFVQSVGMELGQGAGGVTSFDRTVYRLRLPTADRGTLQKGLGLLEDWAHAIRFTPEIVERERGVVLAEHRRRQRRQVELHDRHLPVLLRGSVYAERPPLGRQEVIEQATAERLRSFYETWYTPDRIAVVAVGDFDADRMVEDIRRRFAFAAAGRPPGQTPSLAVPVNEKTLFATGSDAETTAGIVSLAVKHAPIEMRTVGDYRQHLVQLLYRRLLGARLDAAAAGKNPSFLAGVVTDIRFGRLLRAMYLSALAPVEELPRAFEGLLVEVERLRREGFRPGELEREKAALLQAMESAARETASAENLAEECLAHYLEGELMPGIAFEVEAARQLLPGIAARDFDELTRRWTEERNRVVLVTVPEGRSRDAPAETALASRLAAMHDLQLLPAPAATPAAAPMPAAPPAAEVLRRSEIPQLALTQWELANGARVVLKYLPGAGDSVLMAATSPGGYSLLPDQDYTAALVTGPVVAGLGFGALDRSALDALEAEQSVELSVVLGEVAETLRGSAPPQHLEKLLQLVHQAFGSPRRDEKAFAAVLARLEERLTNRGRDPEWRLDEEAYRILTRDHPRARRLTSESLRTVDLDRVLAVYRNRFDAGDFTFVFVGDAQPAALEPLVRSYIGTLASRGQHETWRDLGIAPAAEAIHKRIAFGSGSESRIRVIFHQPFEYNAKNVHELSALALALRRRLEVTLRQSLGETYAVDLNIVTERPPRSRCRLEIELRSAVGREDRILEAIRGIAENLRREPIGGAELASLRQTLAREQEEEPRTAESWLHDLTAAYLYGEDPLALLRRGEPQPLDAEQLQKAARTYLDPASRIELILAPAASPAANPARSHTF